MSTNAGLVYKSKPYYPPWPLIILHASQWILHLSPKLLVHGLQGDNALFIYHKPL